MPDYSKSIAIVYPANWPAEDLAHCTIMFLGKTDEVEFSKQDIQNVIDKFVWPPLLVTPDKIEYFGKANDFKVLTVLNHSLHINHRVISSELAEIGIYSASEFSEYRPHITLNNEIEYVIPNSILLRPPVLWWGEER